MLSYTFLYNFNIKNSSTRFRHSQLNICIYRLSKKNNFNNDEQHFLNMSMYTMLTYFKAQPTKIF